MMEKCSCCEEEVRDIVAGFLFCPVCDIGMKTPAERKAERDRTRDSRRRRRSKRSDTEEPPEDE